MKTIRGLKGSHKEILDREVKDCNKKRVDLVYLIKYFWILF